ncbi:MAG: EpsI family protein [Paucibacter sp.]|nr:EpsI family protein [Roseateles sp.]
MKRRSLSLVLLAAMVGTSTATGVLKPTVMLADELGKLDLETVIPHRFGDWVMEPASAYVVNPQSQAVLDKIYSQTLSRTFVNSSGYRIMLSIAYGLDQRDAMQVHYPEVCYPAQGFALHSNDADTLKTGLGEIAVRRLSTSLSGQRYEPITYWTTVGEHVVKSSSTKKLAELTYGVRGHIPDGLLFRVSSIDRDLPAAHRKQDAFVRDLLQAVEPRYLARVSGLGTRQEIKNRTLTWLD